MNNQSDRIPSLDGLRAISIFLVIISHALLTVPGGALLDSFEGLGGLGVRVFFVISGFLITNLLLQELEAKGTIHLSRFYFRRTLRIFLPYYCFFLIMFIAQTLGWNRLTSNDFLHAATYTMNYAHEPSWELGHTWSLSVEEQFYLLWPAVLLLAGKRRGLCLAAAFFFPIAPAIRLAYWYLQPSLIPYQIGYRFETTADAIAIGCLLAGAHKWLTRQPLYDRILSSKLFILIPCLILYAAIVSEPHHLRYLLFGIPFQNIGIAACVAWGVMNSSNIIGKILNGKVLVFIGTMSYSIYLWQQPFLNPRSAALFASFPLNLLLLTVTSVVFFYLIERPSFGIRKRLEKKLFPEQKCHLVPGEASVDRSGQPA